MASSPPHLPQRRQGGDRLHHQAWRRRRGAAPAPVLPHTHLHELHMLLSLSHRLPTSSHHPGAGTPSPQRPAAQHHKCPHTRQPVLGNGFTPIPSCLIPFFCPHLSFSSNWLCPGCFPCLLFIQHVYITYVLYVLLQHHHHAVHHHFRRSESQSHPDAGPQPCPWRQALQCPLLHHSPKI